MEYEAVPDNSRAEYEIAITSGEPSAIAPALLSIAYWGEDWRWVQGELLRFAEHADPHVRWTAVLGFGHLVRFNGQLDCDVVEPVLRRIAAHDTAPVRFYVRGTAEDSLEDIEIYIHRRRAEGTAFEPACRLT